MRGEPLRDEERAHDVLAADEFALPTRDPELHRPVVLPEDPSGIAEPHDILAAEEFAMPAVAVQSSCTTLARRAGSPRPMALTAAGGALLALIGLRRRRY